MSEKSAEHVYPCVFVLFAQVSAMQSSSSGSLRMGSRGPSVSALQSKLNAVLTPSPRLVADGVFGPKTAQAVKLFQQRHGLTADGVVGPKTAAALGLSLGGMPGGTPVPPPGGGHVIPAPPPGGAPPGFVDLSGFNVVGEALIGGAQKIVSNLLSWIDSDFVPQFVYDRAAGALNGALNNYASALRGITRQAVPLGQNPAVFVTGRMRQILSNLIASLSGAVQPLVGLPVIGSVASRYQALLGNVMSTANTALDNMARNGQSAQATATRIAAIFESIARQIS